ncbi:hypothetical protein C1E23_11555 [Pseudoalteromonas phenolica]|uniref:DUF2884 domain-containing protein n=1 Tax=Pseudoalteromonas phenolica TaxID=161398 RepID=A0A4V2EJN7_9GAMM|nr:YggN family protein [Pseudoalteromonas phenolica]RZQ52988.1 hypothetical protein C1E23_11555 [Pseudoalteromonas phenolica]
MKKLMLATSLVLSISVVAHEDHGIQISSDQCQVDFQNDVRITPNQLQITANSNKQLTIDSFGELYVDGQAITLTNAQKVALSNYADSLRVQLPQVANIALDGVKLAGVALDEVAHAFNLQGLDSLNGLMDELHVEISDTFYQQGAFVMGEKTFHEFGENFDHKFETHIEKAVESAMMESIGSILMMVGSEMVSSGGNMESFEARMEDMGRQIEEKVQLQAKQLEEKAHGLCDTFEVIATAETDLIKEIPAMQGYQLFNYKSK